MAGQLYGSTIGVPTPVSIATWLDAYTQPIIEPVGYVEIWTSINGGYEAQTLLGTFKYVSGTVKIDRSNIIRRTATDITILNDVANDPGGNLLPIAGTKDGWFSPYGNEMRIFKGTNVSGVATYAQLGVFLIDEVDINRDSNGMTFKGTMSDRMEWLSRLSFAFAFTGGLGVGEDVTGAIVEIITNAGSSWGYLTAPFPGLGGLVDIVAPAPQAHYAIGDDPAKLATDMAAAYGCALYFDCTGTLQLQVVPDPSSITSCVEYLANTSTSPYQISRAISNQQVPNVICVESSGTKAKPPVTVWWWDSYPGSPTFYADAPGSWLDPQYTLPVNTGSYSVLLQKFTTNIQQGNPVAAQAMALAIGLTSIGTLEKSTFTLRDQPAHDIDDVITVYNPIAGIPADTYHSFPGFTYILDQVTIDLTAGGTGTQAVGRLVWYPSGGGGGDYTVIFNANGGSGSMSPETHSSATALTTNTFTRTGYTFTGWNTSALGLGVPYSDGESYPFTSPATMYAQWTPEGGEYPSGFTPPAVPDGMSLALFDDFLDTSLNPAYWGGNDYAYNGVSQAFTDGIFLATHLVTLGDSILNLYGYQDPDGCAADGDLPSGLAATVLNWAGAGIQTVSAIDWSPGTRILTAMRADSIDGLTAIALTLGRVNWPPEIDFVECGYPMTSFTSTTIYDASLDKIQKNTSTDGGLTFTLTDWIVFGVQWTDTTIDFLVQLTPSDPLTVWISYANPNDSHSDPHSLAQKMFLALQLQTGDVGTTPSPVDSPSITESNPIKQQHDWVQICMTP